MSVKLADTLAPMGEFPVAEGKDVEVQIGERKKSLQKAIEDGDMGGGGSGKSIIDDETISEESVYSSKKATDEFLTKNGESSDTTVKFTEPEEYTEPTTGSKLSELVGMIVKGIQNVLEAIGKLTDLKTTDKTSVVGAINEINDSLVDIEKDVVKHVCDSINIDTTDGHWECDFSSTSDNTHGTFPVKGMWTKVVQEKSTFFTKQTATLFDVNGYVRAYVRGKWNDGSAWSAWKELATMDKVGNDFRKTVITKVTGIANDDVAIVPPSGASNYIPINARPLNTWNTTPVLFYHTSDKQHYLHSVGPDVQEYEVEWITS